MNHFPLCYPVTMLVLLVLWAGLMRWLCNLTAVEPMHWPEAESPGLALELAMKQTDVEDVLGKLGTTIGVEKRRIARRQQWFDFVFIVLYVLLFIAIACSLNVGRFACAIVVLIVAAGIADVLEDIQILKMTADPPSGSAGLFGRAKWVLYFLALGTTGVALLVRVTLFLHGAPGTHWSEAVIEFPVGSLAALNGLLAAYSASRRHFYGILSGVQYSALSIVLLVFTPLLTHCAAILPAYLEYAVLLRVPLLAMVFLIVLPLAAFTAAKSLLRGMFDLTPPSLFMVAVATMALAGSACVIGFTIFTHAKGRFGIDPPFPLSDSYTWCEWVSATLFLSMPIVLTAAIFSSEENEKVRWRSYAWGAAGILVACAVERSLVGFFQDCGAFSSVAESFESKTAGVSALIGYAPWSDHVNAGLALAVVLVVYAIFGVWGYFRLGKRLMVPALCSALMLVMLLTWITSGISFFFDLWHVPILLIVVVAGVITAQSRQSDHYYNLVDPNVNAPSPIVAAPDAAAAIAPGKGNRVIVAAANGGGIQAGAWAAQVLWELDKDNPGTFRDALRMISSVSGGSMGTAFYLARLRHGAAVKDPPVAASESSLDEVAWGLAWPDFIRALVPWLAGWMIGRGRALERAWCNNCATRAGQPSGLEQPLSWWNGFVANAALPGVIMNGTIAESGKRLLMRTSKTAKDCVAGVDASDLHHINEHQFDISAVTAARLSATFPYVTPVSRSNGDGPQPHIGDGGYYDNYGMASLVEWLDEALTSTTFNVDSVLVLQIHGSKVDLTRNQSGGKNRGWFYQFFAPLATLEAVRGAGQLAHNDNELDLLIGKWNKCNANRMVVHTVPFEFSNDNVPLSWHLTAGDKKAIRQDWNTKMGDCRDQVKRFLCGHNDLKVGCVNCVP